MVGATPCVALPNAGPSSCRASGAKAPARQSGAKAPARHNPGLKPAFTPWSIRFRVRDPHSHRSKPGFQPASLPSKRFSACELRPCRASASALGSCPSKRGGHLSMPAPSHGSGLANNDEMLLARRKIPKALRKHPHLVAIASGLGLAIEVICKRGQRGAGLAAAHPLSGLELVTDAVDAVVLHPVVALELVEVGA